MTGVPTNIVIKVGCVSPQKPNTCFKNSIICKIWELKIQNYCITIFFYYICNPKLKT